MEDKKIAHWNINQRSGVGNSEIPQVIIEEIIKYNPEIFILTEYAKTQNHNSFIDMLVNRSYFVACDPRHVKGVNEVFIACRKNLLTDGELPQIVTLPIDEYNPNFLGIVLKTYNRVINIIGTRIKIGRYSSKQEELNTEFKERKIQFDNLKRYLESIQSSAIVIGDLNNGYFTDTDTIHSYQGKAREHYNYPLIRQEVELLGYRLHTPPGHSCGSNLKLDHIITKGCSINNLMYDWSFTSNPKYCHDTIGYPDHAILSATFNLQ